MSKKLKKSRFTIERRVFQNSTFLRGFSRSQSNTWSDWTPYHDTDSIAILEKVSKRIDNLTNSGDKIQEFRFINNYPMISNQLQFNLIIDKESTIIDE